MCLAVSLAFATPLQGWRKGEEGESVYGVRGGAIYPAEKGEGGVRRACQCPVFECAYAGKETILYSGP